MYTVHVTNGFVLSSYQNRDADMFYYVYTKEYGLLGMSAAGVRLQKSKLRFSLQPLSFISVGFVKGVQRLRITHAELLSSAHDIRAQRLLAKLFDRMRRLVRGEEQSETLFALLEETFFFLRGGGGERSPECAYGAELLFTERLLYILGYWAREEGDATFLDSPFSEDLCQEMFASRKSHIPRIQASLANSQL